MIKDVLGSKNAKMIIMELLDNLLVFEVFNILFFFKTQE